MDGEPIEAADYRELVQVEDPRLSPDGARVAFVRRDPEDDESYRTTVYVVPSDGGDDPRRFTAEDGDDGSPRWSPSGDALAFTSARADADAPQLWLLPTDGGEAERLTDVPGGASAPAWGPDGERIAFTASTTADEREAGHDLDAGEYEREEPDPRVHDRMIYRQHESYTDGARSHVYTVDRDGEVRRHTDGEYDFVSPTFGDDPDTLYYAVKRGPEPDDSVEYDVDALDLPSGEAETVAETTTWLPTLAAEGDLLAYPRTPPERLAARQTEIEVLDRATGETVTPTAALDRTAVGMELDDGALYVHTPDEGAGAVRRFDVGEPPDAQPAPVAREDGAELSAFHVRDGRVAFVRSEWDHRGDVFVTDDGEPRRLTEVNADYLDAHAVAEPEQVRFESDGHEIEGWLLLPPGSEAGENGSGDADTDGGPPREPPHPLAVEIHGGPHAMWTTSGTMWHEYQTLAARGYAVFWCNPRGSTGYGEAFATAILDDWGAVTLADVEAGVDAVCERPAVDAGDVHVSGGSFGGFMTAWAIGHSDRYRSAVPQRGVYELNSFYGSTDAFRLIEDDFDAVPWEYPDYLWEQSPAAAVGDVETPTLVIHAQNDFRVPVNNGELLYLFLRKCGVESRLVRYPREGHELSRSGEPAHVVDRLERIARWFDGYADHVDVPPATERGTDGLSEAASGGPEGDGDDGADGEDGSLA